MIDRFCHLARRFAPVLLASTLFLGTFSAPVVRAQEAEAGEKSEGDPVPGYLGTLLLCMGIMFVVGKSARR
jgi:hypothetical protein